jgi:hypothetical protein
MKTIGDIERWLKGAGKGYTLKLTADSGKFGVHYTLPGADGIYYIAPKSATLEGALENALEELRRKENGAESMRTEKTAKVDATATWAQQLANAYRIHNWFPQSPPASTLPPRGAFICAAHGYYVVAGGGAPKCPSCP